ncbi:Cyclic nucleotide-gated ion channel 2 [Cocos nucifera]|uniref:Cyclic nucleotide-gated ion channel 2 n=1 Tax=Cocos nucifera TaxID=13894 RepID=A0A8K0IVT9_COCNU|nr:Cyclic nucleotide-gated ion channel 2 [Cocos nucifera]
MGSGRKGKRAKEEEEAEETLMVKSLCFEAFFRWEKDVVDVVEQKHGKQKISISFECETLKAENAAEEHIKKYMPNLAGLDAVGRWVGALQHQKIRSDDHDDEDSNNESGGPGGGSNPIPPPAAVECYACTQPGVPAFHSTSCDRAHTPEWEASAGSSLIPIRSQPAARPAAPQRRPNSWIFGSVLDPRSKRVRRWNRAILLGRAAALALDPLFFYALSIGRGGAPCLYMDGGLAAVVTVLRTCADAVHVMHVWLQLRVAYVSRESLVVGCGKLVWDARTVAAHYLRSLKGFWFDIFVILPVPQAVFWLVIPKLIREEEIKLIMTILLLIFLFQFLPKVAGGCWYVLAIQRVASCLQQQCMDELACESNLTTAIGIQNIPVCLNVNGPFRYGIYNWALPVVSSNSLAVKILYPIFWGLMTLSTFGNDLEPTSHWLEVIFSIIIVLSGLMLFTLLIGNIQVFLHAVMVKKRKMQLRFRDMEWWMKRRQLPSRLRQRVRQYECQRWLAMRGEDEVNMIEDFPEGLRRDIKRYLCLDLIKKVPFFHNLDELILDNICDRVKPLVFTKGEKVIREGDPVHCMVFIVRGQLKSSQHLSQGMVATCMLGPGNFLGDELLSWCLRRPFVDRLPASSATFKCIEPTEAFGLDAPHLRYITEHFRYNFANERLKRTARYYSSNWRTWAAVNIQLAWRRYRMRTRGMVIPPSELGDGERRLRLYAAMFMSLRPHDHLD